MKNIITISAVNFRAVWGDSASNANRMLEYTESAGRQGVDMIVFPETALTGYDDEQNKTREEKMHRRLAETVPGPTSNAIAELTKKYGIYALFGLAERDTLDASKVYNAAAICGPEGIIGSYRKIHLPVSEQNWADRGENPALFDTPWGPVGVGICYDFYAYPEITRYARAMGARLFINCTAIRTSESGGAGGHTGNSSIEYLVHNNDMFVVNANLFGKDVTSIFMGGSSIVGPASTPPPNVFYYAGKPYLADGANQGTVATATIDLSIVDISSLNKVWTKPDWRPDRYREWLDTVLKTDFLKDKSSG